MIRSKCQVIALAGSGFHADGEHLWLAEVEICAEKKIRRRVHRWCMITGFLGYWRMRRARRRWVRRAAHKARGCLYIGG